MTILLIRHAESAANFDGTVYDSMADHQIHLTEKGHEQSAALGQFLKDWYANNPPQKDVRLWCSPYKRTMLTLAGLKETIGDLAWNKNNYGDDVHFDDRLREREWGPYSHHHYKEGTALQKENEFMHKYFNRIRETEMGRYFVRPHGGESVADVAQRLHSFFHDLYFDINNGNKDHAIVMHGMAILAFVFAFTKIHPRLFDEEPVMGNTGVRLLDINPATGHYEDYGVIYDPWDNIYLTHKPAQPVQRDQSKIWG